MSAIVTTTATERAAEAPRQATAQWHAQGYAQGRAYGTAILQHGGGLTTSSVAHGATHGLHEKMTRR